MDWRLRNWAWLVTTALLGGCETLPRRGVPAAAVERGAGVEESAPAPATLPDSWRERGEPPVAAGASGDRVAAAPLASETLHPKANGDAATPGVVAARPPVAIAPRAPMIPPKPPQIPGPLTEQNPPLLAVRLAPARGAASTAALDRPAPPNRTAGARAAVEANAPKAAEPPEALPVDQPAAKERPATEATADLAGLPRMPAVPGKLPGESVRPAPFETPPNSAEDITLVKFTEKSSAIPAALHPAPATPPAPTEREHDAPVFPGILPNVPPPASTSAPPLVEPSATVPADFQHDDAAALDAAGPAGGKGLESSAAPAAVAKAADRSALALVRLALCEEIFGFGDFRPYTGKSLKPGQPVLVYAEVRNFASREVAGEFETRLQTELAIAGPDGSTVAVPFDDIVDRCKARRSDFYCRYTFALPAALAPGAHELRVRIKDHDGGAAAEQTLRVDVAPTR